MRKGPIVAVLPAAAPHAVAPPHDDSPEKARDNSEKKKRRRQQKATRQSGRSHDENRERAYIAASRRKDRELSVRIKSAQDASDIHKKRTGKAFRITAEIVQNEEMYEEEETEHRFMALVVHNPTGRPQPDQNKQMCELITSSDQEWRQNAVNQAFANSFPNFKQQTQTCQPWYQLQPPQRTPTMSQQTSPVHASGMLAQFPPPMMPTLPGMRRTSAIQAQSPPWMGQPSGMEVQSPSEMGHTSPTQVQSPRPWMGQTPEMAQITGMVQTSPTQQYFDMGSQFADSGFNTPSADILNGFDLSPTISDGEKFSSESSMSPDTLMYLNPAQLHTLAQVHTCTCTSARKHTCQSCTDGWKPLF